MGLPQGDWGVLKVSGVPRKVNRTVALYYRVNEVFYFTSFEVSINLPYNYSRMRCLIPISTGKVPYISWIVEFVFHSLSHLSSESGILPYTVGKDPVLL